MKAGVLVRRSVKIAMLPAGVLTRRRRGDIVMLLYHRVGRSNREIDIPVDLFERQLSVLANEGSTCSLDAALSERRGGVVVTFDDGFADFHHRVVPLLVRYGIPATLYLATGLVAGEHGAEESTAGIPEKDRLTWSQLREAVSTGLVTIGSHTHRHANLSRASETAAHEEMRRSKDLIESRLGSPSDHFAYPWAVSAPPADRAARRLFRTAARDAWRTNRSGRFDPFRLGRTPVLRSDGTGFFRAKAHGYLDPERVVYRLAGRGPWRKA